MRVQNKRQLISVYTVHWVFLEKAFTNTSSF
jgi:hypothetical protein